MSTSAVSSGSSVITRRVAQLAAVDAQAGEVGHEAVARDPRGSGELAQPDRRQPAFREPRHDRDHATDYVPTLQAWLESQGDPAEAGNRLGVHENTVRYRLRKMAEITNLQLDDAKKRLAMMIELAATDTD